MSYARVWQGGGGHRVGEFNKPPKEVAQAPLKGSGKKAAMFQKLQFVPILNKLFMIPHVGGIGAEALETTSMGKEAIGGDAGYASVVQGVSRRGRRVSVRR